MLTDGPALLRAVCAAPGDDAPRLVMADWYQETGQEDRAEFIRAQVELSRAVPPVGIKDRPADLLGGHGRVFHKRGKHSEWGRRMAALRRRERAQMPTIEGQWQSVIGPMLAGPDRYLPATRVDWTWSRGFIDSLTLPAADFLRVADALCWHPGATDRCPNCGGRGEVRFCDAAGDMDDEPCVACGGNLAGGYNRGKGRVPRPCPSAAQPITRVVLTTVPDDWSSVAWGNAVTFCPGHTFTASRFPGITFTPSGAE